MTGGARQFEAKLSAQELAEIFGVSHVTIHRWVKKRGLPHHKTIGSRLRFSPREVHRFLMARGYDVPPELVRITAERIQHVG